MVPPYNQGTYPPKTLRHFQALLLLHREKIDFLKAQILAKVIEWPWSHQKWPKRVLGDVKVSCVQIWQKIAMGSVPNCRKEIPNCHAIRWFKCKLKLPKKSNTQTMEEVHKKINSHNEVHTYWCQFWYQIWRSAKLFKNTFYAHFEAFWSPSYVMSKLRSICVNLIMSIYYFFVNLLHSPCVWLFDTFLTTWHLFDTWAIGHMGNGVHGQREYLG